MKKIGLFIVFCSLAISAGAWGLEWDFVSQPFFNGYRVMRQTNYTSSALYALLRKGKTNFTACIDSYIEGIVPNSPTPVESFRLIEQTLTPWVAEVRNQITASGRAEEFSDILTWLPAQVTLTSVPCEKADIRVKIASQPSAGNRAWAYNSALQAWQLFLPLGETMPAAAWKESGSFWGLGVLTNTFRPETSEEGRLQNTTDEKYSLYAVANSHPAPQSSVMWWKQAAQTLTCDDVEGFINAVDFVQFMEGETSPRLESGWKSLCGHPYYYLRGRVAADAEELAVLSQETAQLRQTGKTLATLQQLLNQWNTYHQTQVIPVLTQYRNLLVQQARPLDDKGLMLSAQVNHLGQVSECVFHAINRIKEYGQQPQQCGGTDCPVLREELARLSCSTQWDPLKTPGLMEATPLEEDYPTGQMHTCAVCGKPIEIGKAYYDESYTRKKGHVKRYRYFRHTTCSAASAEMARAYHDDAVQVQAPTYAQLQTRTWLAENLPILLARKTGHVESAETTLEKPQTVTSTAQPVTAHEHSRAVDIVKPGEKVRCAVCGEEIHEGETYYKRTESQFMHRGGSCAYRFFARKHKVDEESLASYARSYWQTPAAVESARADMKALGLSTDKMRLLRVQEETALQQQQQAWKQQQRRSENQIVLNIQCRVYRNVTAQDVAQFKTQYAKQLERIARKTANHQTLTKPQQRLQKQYAQLLRDEQKTQECLALEQATH